MRNKTNSKIKVAVGVFCSIKGAIELGKMKAHLSWVSLLYYIYSNTNPLALDPFRIRILLFSERIIPISFAISTSFVR